MNRPEAGTPIAAEALKELFGDDQQAIREVLGSYAVAATVGSEQILSSWASRDPGGVQRASHKLKSSSRSVGAMELADTCYALESAAKQEDWDAIDNICPGLAEMVTLVVDYVERATTE